MQEISLFELLDSLYNDITARNTLLGLDAVPQSDEFFPKIAKKYTLYPFKVPQLMNMLVNANMIFPITTVDEDQKSKITKVDGFIITRGDVIKALKQFYENEFITLYAVEFNKKLSPQKALAEFSTVSGNYNGKPIGRLAKIASMLEHYEKILEWNILKYAKKNQSKLLDEEINNSEPVVNFIIQQAESGKKDRQEAKLNKRVTDLPQHEEINFGEKSNSINSLNVFGIEFYARVAFRKYQFSHMEKLIDEGTISRMNDLKVLKKLLQNIRAHADSDIRLQDYALDFNSLEKKINLKIKQG